MKRTVLEAISAFLIAAPLSTASAADMPLKAPPPPPAPVYNWTGFYLGGQIGDGWGTSFQMGANGFGNTGNYRITGVVGGGTAGYNWQFNPSWVVGIETDFSGAGIVGTTGSSSTYGCIAGCENRIEWFGTVRGRVGYAFNSVLFYGTGGFAYGSAEADIIGCPSGFCGTRTVNGWTAGGGIEIAMDRFWSFKLEYLYVDLNNYNFTLAEGCAGTGGCVSPAKFNVVRVGANYKF